MCLRHTGATGVGPALTASAQAVRPSGTSPPTQTTPTSTNTPAPIPPGVLRTMPAPGQEQPLDAPVELAFDQPMNQASVEQAFSLQPSTSGSFQWVNDQTVQFKPNAGFQRGQNYTLRLAESAKSQAGLALAHPFELNFNAVGFLAVTNVQPADGATEVLPGSVVTVIFNRPVVPLTDLTGATTANLPAPLTFVPPVTGQGEWINTSIYQFTPGPNGFQPATSYTARIMKGLTAVDQSVLAQDFVWTFTTVAPAVVGSIPAQGDIYVSPTPVISLTFTVKAGQRQKVEYEATVAMTQTAQLTMGVKAINSSFPYSDAVALGLPVYPFNSPEIVATAGMLAEKGSRTEGIVLPSQVDRMQGNLTVDIDPSLAAGMRNGLTYLEQFPYECTEQTVSRFLPNLATYLAFQKLKLKEQTLAEKLPNLIGVGLQRLYSQQHIDGGWGWWIEDNSDPNLSAYVLLGLVEARQAGFPTDQTVIDNAVSFLKTNLLAPTDVSAARQANKQAFILYVLAEAGQGDMGRNVTMFAKRQQLDAFGQAYLVLAFHRLDKQAQQISTLLDDIASLAIVDATGAHWQEAQVDYYAMNTNTRSTAIVITALARLQPDNSLLPNAVRWLMSVRQNGGH